MVCAASAVECVWHWLGASKLIHYIIYYFIVTIMFLIECHTKLVQLVNLLLLAYVQWFLPILLLCRVVTGYIQ